MFENVVKIFKFARQAQNMTQAELAERLLSLITGWVCANQSPFAQAAYQQHYDSGRECSDFPFCILARCILDRVHTVENVLF